MFGLGAQKKKGRLADSWAQSIDPYKGHYKTLYKEGRNLLVAAQEDHRSSEFAAQQYGSWGNRLSVLAILLAAGAGVTVLPQSIGRLVTAALAFGAAVVSGLIIGFYPAQKAQTASGRALALEELRDDVYEYLRLMSPVADATADRSAAPQLARLQARHIAIRARA